MPKAPTIESEKNFRMRRLLIEQFAGPACGFFTHFYANCLGGEFPARSGDVVTDLLARAIISPAGQSELVDSSTIARRAGNLLPVFLERVLERVGLHQHVDLPFTVTDFLLEFFTKIDNRLWFLLHEQLDHFLQENALEFFH